jgi:hypothetical protein
MFSLCRTYLYNLVKNQVGIASIKLTREPNVGTQEARIFSIPDRGRIEMLPVRNSNRLVKEYEDWNDLDTLGRPKTKRRVQVAKQFISFVVELTNSTPEKVNADFNKFFRNLATTIYDGQVANYIDKDGVNKTDSAGNVIYVRPGDYDFTDNKFYGDIPSKVYIEIEFEGGIYLTPDIDSGTWSVLSSSMVINHGPEDEFPPEPEPEPEP